MRSTYAFCCEDGKYGPDTLDTIYIIRSFHRGAVRHSFIRATLRDPSPRVPLLSTKPPSDADFLPVPH